MAFVPSASWNSHSITHLANCLSRSLPMNSSDESQFHPCPHRQSPPLPERIRNIHLVKRRGVCAPVRFGSRCKAFDHSHASQIHDANLFLTPIGSVDLAKTGYVFQSSDPWYARNRFH